MLSSHASQRLGTPTRSPGPKRNGASSGRRSGLVWGAVLLLATIALLSVWRLRDAHPHDRRSLLSVGQSFNSLPGVASKSLRGGEREFKLSRELNVTREELLNKEKRVLELEAENSQVRRNHDELLGELDKIKLNKTSGDSDALVQSEGLRGELATALDRAGLAEQRTQIAAGLMAVCETRIQEALARMPALASAAGRPDGSVQAAFDELSSQLSSPTSSGQRAANVMAAGVNGTVHSGVLDQHGGVGAAEVIMQASDAEEAVKQDVNSSSSQGMDPATLSATMHHSAASAHGADAAAQSADAAATAAGAESVSLETGPGLEKV